MTYRAEQIAAIMRWVAAGESGVVIGGSGSGKSNLAGFLSSRPDAIAPHVAHQPDHYCFLSLDINSLPALTGPYFYRGLFQTLRDTLEAFGPEMEQAVQRLTRGQTDWNDPFEVLTLLHKAHRLLIHEAGKKAVWLLDRFDDAGHHLEAQLLSSLRHLRDQFKSRLCYLLFIRHPLAQLRDPAEISEFYDIVAANTCWVGPMVERDARWIARQMAEQLGQTFSEMEVKQLLTVTGGLPAFMKAACLALAEGGLSRDQSVQIWVEQLLTRPEFQHICQELWGDLSLDAQNLLIALAPGSSEATLDSRLGAYLQQTGLLVSLSSASMAEKDGRPGTKLRLFSPLLAAFIAQHHGAAGGVIKLHPQTRMVIRGGVPMNIELSVHEDRLLSYFLEHAGEICQKDVLMRTIWPDEKMLKGVRDDRLAQLIKRLREKIEPDLAHPTYIHTVRGRGYRFVQPEE